MLLSGVLDRLFEYLSTEARTSEVAYFELKLRRVMDLLGQTAFRGHIDSTGRGFCYGWEIYEYLKNPQFVFHGLRPTEEELSVFMRFVGQTAALDLEEKDSVMRARVKYDFLLAQLEQNFFIRLTS